MSTLRDRGISTGARSHSKPRAKSLKSARRSFPNEFAPTAQDWADADELIQHRELLRTGPVRIGLHGEDLVDLADILEGVGPGTWASKAELEEECR